MPEVHCFNDYNIRHILTCSCAVSSAQTNLLLAKSTESGRVIHRFIHIMHNFYTNDTTNNFPAIAGNAKITLDNSAGGMINLT